MHDDALQRYTEANVRPTLHACFPMGLLARMSSMTWRRKGGNRPR